MRGQRPSRGYLGVSLQPVDEDLAPALGIPKDTGELVRSVVPGAPGSARASSQGDVIVKVNGQQVTPDQTVSYLVANTPVRIASPARDHPRRQACDRLRPGRRAPDRGAAGEDRRGGSGTQGDAQIALGALRSGHSDLSLAPLTPDLARARPIFRRLRMG